MIKKEELKIFIIAEIGINYAFGDNKFKFIDNAKKLIDIAAVAGCTHVKFQKRNPKLSTPEHKKNEEKIVPWKKEPITYLQYKKDIEISIGDMKGLFKYAQQKKLIPFASVWDLNSAEQMSKITDVVKIPSAHVTNLELLNLCRKLFIFRLLSTGMSIETEIEKAVDILNPDVIFHTNSVYPTPVEDLNMGYIKYLKEKYSDKQIGYSNHYYGITPMIVASQMGINWIEFHITLDHTLWGSDQKSSVEPIGVFKLTKAIKDMEKAFNKGYAPRVICAGEEKKRSDLACPIQ